ncbi:MAG: PDZ domain-containing protein [Oscillospiraceae bacterium]|jgi:carboxyl-terminal processing protease|nr:PDZ domain-containing protein [Oscillospiraceae bacterium]
MIFLFILNLNIYSTDNASINKNIFSEILTLIDNRFIGDYDIDDVAVAAMRAAVDSLDDQWSYYMTADEYSDYMERSNNSYSGIGVEIVIDDDIGGMKVLNVYRNSGAEMAGIISGDIITAVDGDSIIDMTLMEIRNKLHRQLDTTVLITVFREDGRYHDLSVVYKLIFIDPVSFEMLDDNIGHILLRNFDFGAADGFISAVNDLISQGAVAFVYDVRSNPGGRLNEMTRILDFLLPEGEIFISVDRSGVEQIIRSDAESIDLPAVVLVNSSSYSGAEYFAAMLSEYEYAITVGEQTTGKNRMQTTISLSNGGALHISTGQYLTKNRISLFDTNGFTPEYIIELSEDELILYNRGELEKDSDPQLLKALSLLLLFTQGS